jgi:hypothetical protein
MKNLILSKFYHLIISLLFRYLSVVFKRVYNYQVLKLFIDELNSINYLSVWSLLLTSFKSTNFKEVIGVDNMKIHTLRTKLSEDKLVGVEFNNLLTTHQLEFISIMFIVDLVYKVLSLF